MSGCQVLSMRPEVVAADRGASRPGRKYPLHARVTVKVNGQYREGPVRGFVYRDRLYGVLVDGALTWLPEERILPCS